MFVFAKSSAGGDPVPENQNGARSRLYFLNGRICTGSGNSCLHHSGKSGQRSAYGTGKRLHSQSFHDLILSKVVLWLLLKRL